uniref:Uncharacterized protein n=1 Tax=Moniliophthora roreri TaxID=221103 RepID=A0A0W0G0L5_MONRR
MKIGAAITIGSSFRAGCVPYSSSRHAAPCYSL